VSFARFSPSPLPEALLELHRQSNRETSGRWGASAPHRARVTALVREALPRGRAGARLCVLGAGNCNDLDLEALAPAFEAVHLVDVDDEAVEHAVARQSAAVRARLVVHTPFDLTGAFPLLGSWSRRGPSPADVAELADRAVVAAVDRLPGRFEVVLSSCLLSRMMMTTAAALGARHQALHAVASALGLGHLRAVSARLAPRGAGILVTDLVDSDAYPVEGLFDLRDPVGGMARLESTGLSFPGTTPTLLRQIFQDDAQLAAQLEGVRFVAPWLWQLLPDRTSLVYALLLNARASS
jgi:hypothetical protein